MTSPPRLGFMVRALAHRNYRLFFAGQGTSLVGTWITRVATSWLVYRLTGSAAMLGIVGFAGQIPTFLLAPLAGVWVDRWSRYRVLVITQVLSMLQSLGLAWLAFAGTISVHAHPPPERLPGRDQRLRHPGAPGLRGRDGGGPGGPAQRDRPQLVDGQRRALARPVHGRRAHRRGQRGLVLSPRRPLVRGGHRIAADDAAPAGEAAGAGEARARRSARRLPLQLASGNTIIQTIVREDMRDRVMAFYTMAFMGTAPFGSLLAGVLAARVGAPRTILLGGCACIAGGFAFSRQLPRLRALVLPIYMERGILPEIATALSEAAALGNESER